jgi:ribonucleotide reductase beta subunit family protein with ferritin-like domain
MSIFDKRVKLKPYEYPELMDYSDSINESYWTVGEFNFTQDIQDYKIAITDYERSVIEKSMLAISQIEVNIKTFWGALYTRMPKPEVGIVGSTFSESEARHTLAYSKLLEILGLNDSFELLTDVPEIQGRIKYLEKYMSGIKSRDNKEFIKSLILFSIFTENVSLFSQFITIASFNKERNLFSGISNVIDATSAEENCFIDGTEVLTPNGWVDLKYITLDTEVFQFNQGVIEKTLPYGVVEKDYSGDLIKLHKRKHSCVVTPDHNIVYYNKDGVKKELPCEKFNGDPERYIPESGFYNNSVGQTSLTPLQKLYIAIQADGHKIYWTNASGEKLERGKNGGYNYCVRLTKERKKERFESILKESDVDFDRKEVKSTEIEYKIRLDNIFNYKNFDWVDVNNVTSSWCDEFVNELSEWDGFKMDGTKCLFGYSSTDKGNIDKAQLIGILAGYKTTIIKRIDNRKESYKDCYKVHFTKDKMYTRSHSLKKENIPYSGKVRCISVPSGVLITRNNNETFITGNCHGMFGMYIVNVVRKEFPEWFDEEMEEYVYKACQKAYNAELGIIEWIFGGQDLSFLKRHDVSEYIKNRFNNSLVGIGYKPMFETDPVALKKTEWFDVQIKSSKEDDFFYKKSTAYNKFSKPITENDLF